MRALVCLLNGKRSQKQEEHSSGTRYPSVTPSLPFDFIHRDRMVKTFGLSCPTSTKNLGAIGIQFERSAPATCDRVLLGQNRTARYTAALLQHLWNEDCCALVVLAVGFAEKAHQIALF